MFLRLMVCMALAFGLSAQNTGAHNSDPQRLSNNRIYSSERHLFKTTPNSFMVQVVTGRVPGTALDIAMGQGRNALWLAEQGWQVTGFDISDVALAEAQTQARQRNLKIETIQSKYEQFDYGKNKWDLIVLAYFFPRELVPKLFDSLRPGGLIVLEYFHKDAQKTRLIDGTDLVELSTLFSAYRILRYENAVGPHDWGLTLGKEQPVVRLSAQRPGAQTAGCSWKDAPVRTGGTACWTERNFLMRCADSGWEYPGKCSADK
jgi:2-polyprenyl-3-methyl-5-hydroxy-6-metoxy-1,4-benzoquinol methylase